MRALRATKASSPRVMKISSAPTNGRKVVRERIGKSVMLASASERDQIPADQRDDADQHGKGVMIDIAALQPAGPAGEADRELGNAVRSQPIDDGPVPALPQDAAERLRR